LGRGGLTSIDGESWIRLPGVDPSMSTLADPGRQEIKALVLIEGGFFALGAEGESESDWDARVWIGTSTPLASGSAGPRRYAGTERR